MYLALFECVWVYFSLSNPSELRSGRDSNEGHVYAKETPRDGYLLHFWCMARTFLRLSGHYLISLERKIVQTHSIDEKIRKLS